MVILPDMCVRTSACVEGYCLQWLDHLNVFECMIKIREQNRNGMLKERRVKTEFQSIGDCAGRIVTLPLWKHVLQILCAQWQ